MYIYTYIWEYFKNHSVLALYSNFEYNSSNQNLESEQYFIILLLLFYSFNSTDFVVMPGSKWPEGE